MKDLGEHLTGWAVVLFLVGIPSSVVMLLFYTVHTFTPLARGLVALQRVTQHAMIFLYAAAMYVPLTLISFFLLPAASILKAFGQSILLVHALFAVLGCECAWQLLKVNKWNGFLVFLNALAGGILLLFYFG